MPCCLRNPLSLPDMILFVCHAQTALCMAYPFRFHLITFLVVIYIHFLESALNSIAVSVTEGLIKCSYIFYTMCSART
jgi:hypothetical protein